MITVFTPTYNRAYILPELYKSLQAQTNKDFEWLVVDDGSTDDTEALFEEWIKEPSFPVRYIKQGNGGKHRAINRGVKEAKGELFFIVDSDDTLTSDAIELIRYYNKKIIDTYDIGGLCFRKKGIETGKTLGDAFPEKILECSSLDLAYKYRLNCDKAEIFKNCVLEEFPFPEYSNENFIPEALVWNRIADKYKLLCVDKGIYNCEYLEDGLTKNFGKNIRKNPRGFSLFYYETFLRRYIPFKERAKCLIRIMQCYVYIITNRI